MAFEADNEEARRFVEMMTEKHSLLYRHALNVAFLSGSIAEVVGLNRKIRETEIYLFGLLHDVGWLNFRDELFTKKKSEYTEQDFEDHFFEPYEAWKILQGTKTLKKYATVALKCHEQPEGDGYPEGIHLHKIDRISRVVSVACRYSTIIEDHRLEGRDLAPHMIDRSLHKDIVLFFGRKAEEIERALLTGQTMNDKYWNARRH